MKKGQVLEQAMGEALSQPIVIRLNTTGDVLAVGLALDGFADFCEQQNAPRTAASMRGLLGQIIAAVPADWDCGDPDCEACGKAREERQGVVLRFPAPHLRGDA
jgi:hypothetical protein